MTNLTKWHIKNTGLIITHPFLTQLFRSVAYLNDANQFKNDELQYRAVYLLHYVASGDNTTINEAELAMPKVLCGMQIQDPVPADLILVKEEKTEANELLTALISNWDKLGNTSPDGLRNTFLNRNGLLEEKNEAYQLTIETGSIDILLNYIPWHINLVKLPWLKQIIYSSWR